VSKEYPVDFNDVIDEITNYHLGKPCMHHWFEFKRVDERSFEWCCTVCGREITCDECAVEKCETRNRVNHCARATPPPWKQVKNRKLVRRNTSE